MTTTAIRTFDCPWCGAINPVPADHIGEHFPCPECRKATKLTEKNTSSLPPTAAPPDAPHLTGDRTFDCPWCGAISAIASSHLGEKFHCPECGRETKLTPTNTRRAPITAPPPEAPHEEPAGAGMGKGLWIVLAIAAVGVGAWFATRGSDSAESESNKVVAGAPRADDPASKKTEPSVPETGTAPSAMADPSGMEGAPTPGTPPTEGAPSAMTEEGPSMAEAGPSPQLLEAQADLATAARALEAATTAHKAAVELLDAWKKDHPGAFEASADLVVLGEIGGEAQRLRGEVKGAAEPGKVEPAAVFAYNAAMVKFMEASPERSRTADALLGSMRADLGGREVAGLSDWKGVNFFGSGFQRAQSNQLDTAQRLAAAIPQSLVTGEASLRKVLAESKVAFDVAEARVKSLAPSPPK